MRDDTHALSHMIRELMLEHHASAETVLIGLLQCLEAHPDASHVDLYYELRFLLELHELASDRITLDWPYVP